MKQGIFADISNEDYHASEGVSKSGLHTLLTQTPAHYKYAEREDKQEFDFGTACHTAILEPDTFEARTMRGPADRRGNVWKDAQAEAVNSKRSLLTAPDYDAVMVIRDAIHADAWLNSIISHSAAQVERSCFWKDPEHGVQLRSRPDLYRPDLAIMLDLKTTTSAAPSQFAKSVVDYGYHMQEAIYTAGHRMNGQPVEGFVFLAVEKKKPFAYAVYELPPSIVSEGDAMWRKAMGVYAECERYGIWPGYPNGVRELAFPRWAYKETKVPEGQE